MYRDFQPAGADVTVILGDTAERARKYAELVKAPFPVLADPDRAVYHSFERNCVLEINLQAPLVTRKETFIKASPEAVWKIQTDISAWKEWQPDISKSQLDGALTTGSVFKWTSGGFTVTSTLHEVVPQQRIAWTGKAVGLLARHIWRFKSQNGGTLVITEESMEGWLIAILKPLMPNFLDKALDAWVKNLKNKAEGKTRTYYTSGEKEKNMRNMKTGSYKDGNPACGKQGAMTIRRAVSSERDILVDIWLRSVRATHTFLSEEDIQSLLPLTREYLRSDEPELWVLCSDSGTVMGFMGMSGNNIEALFLAPEFHRRGGGRGLVRHAQELRGELTVDVNEQNQAARRFYEACGFVVEGRSELDDAGRPFPLLHMRLPAPNQALQPTEQSQMLVTDGLDRMIE